MKIVYTIIKEKDLKAIIKKETGLSIPKFANLCPGKTAAYLYSLDRGYLRISSEKWDILKSQIESLREFKKKL